jgi:AcrR family transcriptional regulator
MDNRFTILSVALDLFSRRGYDAVGVQEIVDAAGITKPTLYHYFGSKRGLLQALLEQQFAPLIAALANAAAYQGDLTLNLQRITQTLFDYAQSHPSFYRMQIALWFAPRQSEAQGLVAQYNNQLHMLVEQMFEQAITQHGNMRGRQRAYAASFIGLVNTYIGLWLNGHTELNDELVYRVVHQFEHGVYS